jgi:hypothetical protein
VLEDSMHFWVVIKSSVKLPQWLKQEEWILDSLLLRGLGRETLYELRASSNESDKAIGIFSRT